MIFETEIAEIKRDLGFITQLKSLFEKKSKAQYCFSFITGKIKKTLLKKVIVTDLDLKGDPDLEKWVVQKYFYDFRDEPEYLADMVELCELDDLGGGWGSGLTYSVLKNEMKVLTLKGKIYLKYSARFNKKKDLHLVPSKQELKFLAKKEIDEGTTDFYLADTKG